MKFILLSECDQTDLVSRLQQQGHVVLLTTHDFEIAVPAILRGRPHALLVCGSSDETFVQQASEFCSGLPDQHLVLNQPTDSMETLDLQINATRRKVDGYKQRPSANRRVLFFDPEFAHKSHSAQTERSKPEHVELLAEQDKVLVLLAQAVESHRVACRYFNEVTLWSPDEIREMAYRMTTDSRISASYAREQAGRWLAVLAHYIPHADPCYFPTPGDAIHGADWIFSGCSPEAAYALHTVEQLQFTKGMREPLSKQFSLDLASTDESLIAQIALALTGASVQLQAMAEAHLSTISKHLNENVEVSPSEGTKRNRAQEHQMFCEFWGLPLMRDYPQLLAKTVADFYRGRRSATEVSAPLFAHILTRLQSSTS